MRITSRRKKAYLAALKTVSFPISMLLACFFFRVMVDSHLWEAIIKSWPYDYGDVHSKNLLAPLGVLAVVSYFLTGWLIERFLLSDETQKQLKLDYDSKLSAQKFDGALSEGLTFFFVALAVLVAFGVWIGAIICFMLLLALELWVRSRIKQNGGLS